MANLTLTLNHEQKILRYFREAPCNAGDHLGDQIGQARITEEQPTTRSYSVGLVLELVLFSELLSHLDEVFESGDRSEHE